jgi:glutamyl aminopeptidase
LIQVLHYSRFLKGDHLSHPVIKPISNPYEIEEYFDRIETSKVAAVLRMIEEEIGQEKLLEALIVSQ